jgi:hypothetical protein
MIFRDSCHCATKLSSRPERSAVEGPAVHATFFASEPLTQNTSVMSREFIE